MYKNRFHLSIALLSLACAPAFAAHCPSGSTQITSSLAGGNASSAATWGGQSLGTGDGMCLLIQGPVILDQNLGTPGGTGVYTIIQEGLGSLAVDSSAARHIYFASTGSNPIGSGSAASPGTDANMYGFFFPSGSLALTGTQANPIVITSANGTNPWYIAGGTPELLPGFSLTLTWCQCSLLGSSMGFLGVFIDTQTFTGSETVDIENNWFSNPYDVLYMENGHQGPGRLTVLNNVITGRAGSSTLNIGGITTNPNIQNNTESAPNHVGTFALFGALAGSSIAYQQNAVAGTSAAAIGNLTAVADLSGSGTIQGNLTWNDPAQAGALAAAGLNIGTSSAFTGLVDSNYCEGCFYAAAVRGYNPPAALTLSNNFAVTNHLASPSQGIYFISGGVVNLTGNIGVYSDATQGQSPEMCIFGYSTKTLLTAENNTCHSVSGPVGSSWALQIGELGYPASAALVDHNLISGFQFGIIDGDPGNKYADSYAGVGVHHNDVWNAELAYMRDGSPRFDNGSQAHPNAAYGDLTLNPEYLDPTRLSLANYDSLVLGGPGTAADFIARVARRSGWGGNYQLGGNPIADALTWFRTGFTPANPAVCPGGVTTGAMPCADSVLTFSPATLPAATQGAGYSQTLSVNSGVDCTFNITGILPLGLSIGFTGTSNVASFSGIPLLVGSSTFSVGAVCANGLTSASLTIDVTSPYQAIDVSSLVNITASGLLFSRATNLYNGTVTIGNTGSSSIQAPLQLVLSSLIPTGSLVNKTGNTPGGPFTGAPYITLPGTSALAPGASVTVPVEFSNPNHLVIFYIPKLLSGAL